MRLEGKVAIITGAGSGIGRATSLMFAKEGARVVAAGRRSEPISQVVDLITAEGGEAIYHQADVMKVDQIKALVEKTLSAYGKLDVVFANAGINPSRTTILDTTEKNWQKTLDTNLTGVFLTCKYSIPPMIENGGGSIIINSSLAGLIGLKKRIPYAASKGGVNQLTKCLAIDCAPYNVRVNAICPGRVLTDLVKHLQAPGGDWEEVSKLYPLGMRGKPEDIAYAAVYLASDESSWVTGVLLPVDGGGHVK
ncbi:MAG: SDR family oxidoreductase [Deltaproteobacteria bacterium]|nr:SDR family oxidoreductase [Deltaproteobacteria bacterium]MBW2307431.1 SDR family oxidoreductase [Deltaproteobacteria bacterium]